MPKYTPEPTQLPFDFDEIQPGYCRCGCGQKTSIPSVSSKTIGRVKGEPMRFINGHNGRIFRPPAPPKLCECGCGQPTPIAKKTQKSIGHVKGEPVRFISNHHRRGVHENPDLTLFPLGYGLCQCGCGQQTPIATKTNRRYGWARGQHLQRIPWHGRKGDIEERFWAKVDRSGGPDACWLWQAGKTKFGYGCFGIAGKESFALAHRVSYELHYGPIPEGMNVLHDCPSGDNPSCVNFAHLWLGTIKDNNQDMHDKGRNRHPRGETHCNSRFSHEQIREIRALYATGQHSQCGLARERGVSQSTIRCIVLRKTYKHID